MLFPQKNMNTKIWSDTPCPINNIQLILLLLFNTPGRLFHPYPISYFLIHLVSKHLLSIYYIPGIQVDLVNQKNKRTWFLPLRNSQDSGGNRQEYRLTMINQIQVCLFSPQPLQPHSPTIKLWENWVCILQHWNHSAICIIWHVQMLNRCLLDELSTMVKVFMRYKYLRNFLKNLKREKLLIAFCLRRVDMHREKWVWSSDHQEWSALYGTFVNVWRYF